MGFLSMIETPESYNKIFNSLEFTKKSIQEQKTNLDFFYKKYELMNELLAIRKATKGIEESSQSNTFGHFLKGQYKILKSLSEITGFNDEVFDLLKNKIGDNAKKFLSNYEKENYLKLFNKFRINNNVNHDAEKEKIILDLKEKTYSVEKFLLNLEQQFKEEERLKEEHKRHNDNQKLNSLMWS